ncbi:hypothetical protein BDW22DRAFT_1358637 [Trametopsis cervina]|nr:hypothetical protein BDW22DRAFT_1358637 [Trametopsis cervina]
MSPTEPIVLYDIAWALPLRAWNPNTWKVRAVLNYKGIAYRTEWIEFPDIEPLAKSLGVPPTSKKPSGEPLYTLPMILDPSTGKVIADSLPIALYLDEQYPDTPRVVPSGTLSAHREFAATFQSQVLEPLRCFMLSRVGAKVSKRAAEYLQGVYESQLAAPGNWEDIENAYVLHMQMRGAIYDGLAVAEQTDSGSSSGEEDAGDLAPQLQEAGKTMLFCDILVLSVFMAARRVGGEDCMEWKRFTVANNGYGERFMKQFEKYALMDL